ncbi:MAG: hypothetical protein HYR60_07460 [Acidobacteria bacterium]|nr:hypothetical protein [Acidobacteriota bacterium]
MNRLSARDRRAILLLAVAAAVMVVWRMVLSGPAATAEAAVDSVPMVEKQLARLRQSAAALPAKETFERRALERVAELEKGMLRADTAEQAQAELLKIVRELAKAEKIDARGGELGPVRPLGEDYGEVAVSVSFECGIEQLVNLLAVLTQQSAMLATNEIQVTSANAKTKMTGVRLTLAGVVPRKLAPEKKGGALF